MSSRKDSKQKKVFILKPEWKSNIQDWERTDVLEKKYNLKERDIIRWCISIPVPMIYYHINCDFACISPKLVEANYLQMDKAT